MPVDRARAQAIVRLARAQNGAVTAEQLRAEGLTRHAIQARVESGRLVRQFRGVYTVGDPELMPLARLSAALLSLGPSAVLSHRSAAAVWGLAEADPGVIHVTVVSCRPRARAGVRLHHAQSLQDVTTHGNLPLTTTARTLIDFAVHATSSELAHAFGEARAKRHLTDGKLAAALARAPRNHPGAATVRAMFREGGTYDRSKAEDMMRRYLGAASLPQPQVNVILLGHLVDFFWREQKVVVEVDGYGTHGNRAAFENDRKRDQALVAAGYIVIRVTWRQLQHEPLAVIAAIAQGLARRAA